jgi:hypothetical protein
MEYLYVGMPTSGYLYGRQPSYYILIIIYTYNTYLCIYNMCVYIHVLLSTIDHSCMGQALSLSAKATWVEEA